MLCEDCVDFAGVFVGDVHENCDGLATEKDNAWDFDAVSLDMGDELDETNAAGSEFVNGLEFDAFEVEGWVEAVKPAAEEGSAEGEGCVAGLGNGDWDGLATKIEGQGHCIVYNGKMGLAKIAML